LADSPQVLVASDDSVIPPRYLYKYRSIMAGASASLNLERLIVHNELWFANPTLFNDPFDVEFTYTLSRPSGDSSVKCTRLDPQKQFLTSLGIDHHNVSDYLDSIRGSDEDLKAVKDQARRTLTQRGVLTVSAKRNRILMWSHYADEHRGVCLEFTSRADPFNCSARVAYKRHFLRTI